MPIDYTRYPPDWKQRVERIRKRDRHRCRHCGRTENLRPTEGHRRVILTTAHLDHDEENWDVSDDRLATLCAPCHLRYDAADNRRRRSYGKRYSATMPKLFPQ